MSCVILESFDAIWVQLRPVSQELTIFTEISQVSANAVDRVEK